MKMFYCQLGFHFTKPCDKQVKIVSQRRDRIYPDQSRGWEIVSTVNSCAECSKDVDKVASVVKPLITAN